MPALAVGPGPVLGHVSLMVDSFIANINIDEQALRAIVRTTLATSPNVASTFTAAARRRLELGCNISIRGETLFKRADGRVVPTPELAVVLARVRALYGAGMGFESLRVLTDIVRATIGTRWEEGCEMAHSLAMIDADIAQAIQSSKEELSEGRVADLTSASACVDGLRAVLMDSCRDVEGWEGDTPFERAIMSIEHWNIHVNGKVL